MQHIAGWMKLRMKLLVKIGKNMQHNTTEELKKIVKRLWEFKDEKLIRLALSCLESKDSQQSMLLWLEDNSNCKKIEAQNKLLEYTIK